MGRPTVAAQIGEVEYELKMRERVYAGATSRKKQRENEMHLALMREVLSTLRYLRDGAGKRADHLPEPGQLLGCRFAVRNMLNGWTTKTPGAQTRIIALVWREIESVLSGTDEELRQ